MKKLIMTFLISISFFVCCSATFAERPDYHPPRNLEYMGFYSVYIMDSQPDSFKEFMLNHNTPELIKNLKSGLDETSIKYLDNAINVIINIPDEKYAKYLYIDKYKFEEKFASDEYKIASYNLDCEFNKEIVKYKLSVYLKAIIAYHHGLKYANELIKDYVKNKAFIDIGAFCGDSAVILAQYLPSKIYSFDISSKSIKFYKEAMKENNIPDALYEIHRLAISDKKTVYRFIDRGHTTDNIFENNGTKVYSTDLDSFLKNRKEQVGFIKVNIEGATLKALQGMQETIKKNRPVLVLAIDESPEEFFYTKPLLEEITKDLNYTIKIRSARNCPFLYNILGLEIFAYPKELDD